ncbi:MAG: 4Fe-4S binding protein [Clostridiales bacterium]|nr:4Fe-4S binding protein [Clostridiales bacterium]
MKIAVLSGKGGAGKTFAAVNLAVAAGNAVYIDCDVEEPNGRIFLKPEIENEIPVDIKLPKFDADKCNGCRKCVEFCRFNALIYIKNRPDVFSEVCHSCGGCMLVCPENAISEENKNIGKVEIGHRRDIKVVTGVLNIGEASGVPVINAALRADIDYNRNIIVDCPPGSACSVVESISEVDYCILVAEPTAFGFHNFKMVYELATLLNKPCSVVINKMDEVYEPLESFCQEKNIPIVMRIPFNKGIAEIVSRGDVLVDKDNSYKQLFVNALREMVGETK